MKVNDIVRVVRGDYTYTTYKDMFKSMGFFNTEGNKAFEDGTIAKVFKRGIHPRDGNVLVAIVDQDGNESLISEEGLEVLSFDRGKPISVKISPDYSAIVYKDHIQVGCQRVSKESFEKLIEAAKKQKLI